MDRHFFQEGPQMASKYVKRYSISHYRNFSQNCKEGAPGWLI